MAYIPIAEVPNAPQNQQMPLVNYPSIPAIRSRGVDMKVNMGPEIAALQQKELPGGFAEGMQRAAKVAGTGDAAMGNIIEEQGAQLFRTAGAAVRILGQLREKALDSQDSVALWQAEQNQTNLRLEFERDMAQNGTPKAQQSAIWQKDYLTRLPEMNGALGVRRSTRDRIAAYDRGFATSSTYKMEADAALGLIKDNTELKTALTEQKMQNGDTHGAREIVADQLSRKEITPGEAQRRYNKLDKQDRNEAEASLLSTPEGAKNALQFTTDISEGKPAPKGFEYLGTDPVANLDLKEKAETQVSQNRHEAMQKLQEDAEGGVITTRDEPTFVAEAKARNIPEVDAKAVFQRLTTPDPAYNEKVISDLSTRIENYRSDRAALDASDQTKPDKITREEYRKIQQDIETKVPKTMRSKLQKELDDRFDQGKDGDALTEKQVAMGDLSTRVDRLRDRGLFGPVLNTEKFYKDRGTKPTASEIADDNLAHQRASGLKAELKTLSKKDESTPGEMEQLYSERIQPLEQKNGDKSLKDTSTSNRTRGAAAPETKTAGEAEQLWKQKTVGGYPIAPDTSEPNKEKAAPPTIPLNVYNQETGKFEKAPQPAHQEMLKQVRNEYDALTQVRIRLKDRPLGEALNSVSNSILSDEYKKAIVREARKLAKEKNISPTDAAQQVIERVQAGAAENVQAARKALNIKPGVEPTESANTSNERPFGDQVAGMVKPGNLDVFNRKVLTNADGTVSTTLSFSIHTESGEVLIPQVVDGKKLTKQEAIKHYKETGQHLGIFKDADSADAYASNLHDLQEERLKEPDLSLSTGVEDIIPLNP